MSPENKEGIIYKWFWEGKITIKIAEDKHD